LLLLIGYATGRVITDARPSWDASLLADLRGPDHGTLTDLMRIITGLGSTPVLDGVFILAISTLLVRRYSRAALFLLLASPGTVLLVQLIKHSVNRARPAGHHLSAAQGASWPSGHASSSLALYGGLLLIASSVQMNGGLERARGARVAATYLTVALLTLIGFSRVYLGVHYPTDVLAAWLLVAGWLTVLERTVGHAGPVLLDASERA
jgi:undecaprenyl-diphosphatase